MELADHFEAALFYARDRGEAFVSQSVSRELLEAAKSAIVVELGVGFKQGQPRLAIALLQRFDGCFDDRVGKCVRDHWLFDAGG